MFFRTKRKQADGDRFSAQYNKKLRLESISIYFLPAEMIDNIAMSLSFSDLLAFSLTCKDLYAKTHARSKKFKYSLVSVERMCTDEGTYSQIRLLLNDQYITYQRAKKYKKFIDFHNKYFTFSNLILFYVTCYFVDFANRNSLLPYGSIINQCLTRSIGLTSASYNFLNLFRMSNPFHETVDEKVEKIEKKQFKIIVNSKV